MSRKPKRTRITARKEDAVKSTIREVVRTKGNSTWGTFLVQGWQEAGKWQRKQFKDRGEVESFAAIKRVQLRNQGAEQRMILSRPTQEQHDEAVGIFDRLGADYSLGDAVDFFLKHHRPPEFTIRMDDALKLYHDDKERDGVRERTGKAIKSVLNEFLTATDNPWVHEVTPQDVEAYLRGLLAKDGVEKATRKTWNNYRNDLNGFFAWCATPDKATNRPFTFENPVVGGRKFKAKQVRKEQEATPATTSPDSVLRIFSVGDAALQEGNSESIVKRHYLNAHAREEGEAFWRITPDMKRRRAVLAPEPKTKPTPHLVAV